MNTPRGALVDVSNTYSVTTPVSEVKKDDAGFITSPALKMSDKALQQSSPMSFNDSGALSPQVDLPARDSGQRSGGIAQQEAPQSPVSFSDSHAAPMSAGSPAGAIAVKRSEGSAQLRTPQSPVSFSDSNAALIPIAAGSPAGAAEVKRSGGSAQLKAPQSPVSFSDNNIAPVSAGIKPPLPSIYDAFLNDKSDLSGPMIVTPPSGGRNHETLPSYAHSPSVTGRLNFSEFLSPVLNASYLLEREQQSEAKRRQEEEDSYKGEIQRLGSVIVSLEQELGLISEQLSERVTQLQAKVDQHQDELAQEKLDAEARIAELNGRLAQAETLIESTNQQLGEAKLQAEQFQSQSTNLSRQLAERSEQLQSKVGEHQEELTQERSEAEIRIVQLSESLVQANNSIVLMSQTLAEAQSQAKQLQSQKDELLSQFSEKSAQLQVKVNEYQEVLLKEKTEAEASIVDLNKKLAQANSSTQLTSQQLKEAQAQAEHFQKLHAALLGQLSAKTREHKEEVGEHKELLTQRQSEAEENLNLLFILYLIAQEKLNKAIESKKEVEATNSNDFIDLAAEYQRKLDITALNVDELKSELKQHQDDRIHARMAADDLKRKNIAKLKTLGYSHDDNLAAHNQFNKAKELFFAARKNSSLQLAGSSDIDGLIAKLNELSVKFKNDTGIINSYTQTLTTTALCLYGDDGEAPFRRLNNLANGRYYQNNESDDLVARVIPEKARNPFLYLLVGIVLVAAVIAAGVFLLPASMTSGVVSAVTANLNSSVPAIVAAGASVLLTGSFFHKPEAPRAAQARVVCDKLGERVLVI